MNISRDHQNELFDILPEAIREACFRHPLVQQHVGLYLTGQCSRMGMYEKLVLALVTANSELLQSLVRCASPPMIELSATERGSFLAESVLLWSRFRDLEAENKSLKERCEELRCELCEANSR